jgi:hypothetical protein
MSSALNIEDAPNIPRHASSWRVRNDRRVELIYKKMAFVLDAREQSELATLQEAASRHADRVAPLPLDHIAEFEADAKSVLSHRNAPGTAD